MMDQDGIDPRTFSSTEVPALRRLTLLGIVLVAVTLCAGGLIVWNLRQDTWKQAETASVNLAAALEREVSRTFETYDLSILGAIEAVRQPGIFAVGRGIRQAALFDHSATAANLGRMLILDRDGAVVASSRPDPSDRLNYAALPFFARLRDGTAPGLQIGSPKPGGANDDGTGQVLRLSRRILGPGNTFAGAVVGSLRLGYFNQLFAPFDVGTRGAIAAITLDGALIARKPSLPDEAVRDVTKMRLFDELALGPVGQYTAPSAVDGLERLITFRRIAGLPIVITIALSSDEVFAAWHRKAVAIAGVLTLICVATLVLLGLFRREVLLRVSNERRIADAAAQLAVAASTDGLTGLSNRRAFDVRLRREWLRSAARREPVALLMLDADRFKAYNDRYGHQAGDDVLQVLASCILATVPRDATAMAARYGGEEFVVLLPRTDTAGAAAIAQAIRTALESRAISHEAAAHGTVTVSIGVASLIPAATDDAATLLRAADEALYAAKTAGRNCVRIADPPAPAAGRAAWTAQHGQAAAPPILLPALFAH